MVYYTNVTSHIVKEQHLVLFVSKNTAQNKFEERVYLLSTYQVISVGKAIRLQNEQKNPTFS